MSLQDDGVNVRKSSFSALLQQQQLRIPGLGMMGVWVGKGGGGGRGYRTTHLPDDLSL